MTKAMLKSMLMQELQGICKMKVTKRQLKRIIREEALNEGLWDTIKGAVGMGPDPEEAGREIQNAFDKMGNGVGALLKLARKGSQMAKYWESFTGESRPEALMRGSIPSEFYRSSAKGSHGNILNSVGKLKDHWYDTMWNALVVAAPDAGAELDQIFRDLASKPSDRTARKLRDIGVKIKDEALGSGKEDELVKFNKLLKQWAGEEINQSSYSANAWFNTHQGSFGLGESRRITKRQLKRIIKEEYTKLKRRGLIREIGEPGLESYGGELTTIEVDANAYGWNSYEDILATIQNDVIFKFNYHSKSGSKKIKEIDVVDFVDVKGWKSIGNKVPTYKRMSAYEIIKKEIENVKEDSNSDVLDPDDNTDSNTLNLFE